MLVTQPVLALPWPHHLQSMDGESEDVSNHNDATFGPKHLAGHKP